MIENELPTRDEMLTAFLQRDPTYDGVFVTAVATTGIFCRPSCTARKPLPENVDFFANARDALTAGYRPCLRCRPLEPPGSAPAWVRDLLNDVDQDPSRRWTDQDLRQRGLHPDRVRRWFQQHHGMTFHAHNRARRLGLALGRIRHGSEVTGSAYDHGFDSLSGFNDAFKRLFGTSPGRAGSTSSVTVTRYLSPLGPMLVGATDDAVCLLEFVDRRMLQTQLRTLASRLGCSFVPGSNPVIDRAVEELDAYFAGTLERFAMPLHTPGTDFQTAVWNRLLEIPYGTTVSYAVVARDIGRPSAVRAVARANGDNRIAIVIPCHRVIGSDGRLTGYGGGLWRKKKLLDHERSHREGGGG
jgi:AraC family transcriptional regulator of adaptative response/methylated-DNA-[protein]-cysteine methyltransferase